MPHYDFGRFPKAEHQKEWCDALLKVRSKLNNWEIGFIISINVQLQRNVKLNEEQVFKLETMYAKYT